MWLEVWETEDCMMDAMYQESRCGWKYEIQRTEWWTQGIRSQDVVGGRKDRGLYDGRNV